MAVVVIKLSGKETKRPLTSQEKLNVSMKEHFVMLEMLQEIAVQRTLVTRAGMRRLIKWLEAGAQKALRVNAWISTSPDAGRTVNVGHFSSTRPCERVSIFC